MGRGLRTVRKRLIVILAAVLAAAVTAYLLVPNGGGLLSWAWLQTGEPSGSGGRASPIASPVPQRQWVVRFPLSANQAGPQAATRPSPTPSPRPSATPVPTPTPPPVTPTPTPQLPPRLQGLPPSPYKRLADYPRPKPDSGYGFHINAAAYPPDPVVFEQQILPNLKALGATWVTVWLANASPASLDYVKKLIDNGFEVVLRYHPVVPAPHPYYVPDPNELAQFTRLGVHYIVTGNEPNLKNENVDDRVHSAAEIARQWVVSADRIKAAGGIPILYPMSSGPSGMEMLRGMLEWMKANNALDALDGAAVAIHNRPLNKPLDVIDDSSFRTYELVDDLIREYLGHSLPILGTEAGYTFGDLIDPRFPRVSPEGHMNGNLEIIYGFRDGRWRDSLFCQNFWILSGFGTRTFFADWWIENPLYFGQSLPIVEALKSMPKFERKFQSPDFQR